MIETSWGCEANRYQHNHLIATNRDHIIRLNYDNTSIRLFQGRPELNHFKTLDLCNKCEVLTEIRTFRPMYVVRLYRLGFPVNMKMRPSYTDEAAWYEHRFWELVIESGR